MAPGWACACSHSRHSPGSRGSKYWAPDIVASSVWASRSTPGREQRGWASGGVLDTRRADVREKNEAVEMLRGRSS